MIAGKQCFFDLNQNHASLKIVKATDALFRRPAGHISWVPPVVSTVEAIVVNIDYITASFADTELV